MGLVTPHERKALGYSVGEGVAIKAMSSRILRGNILSFCRHYHGPKFHALLCDPPYHLTDPRDPCRQSPRKSSRDKRTPAAGFMGKAWDGGDVAFDPATWVALAEHLLPGAFGMAFASSRGWHRLAVAIEDAGLIIHPSIFGWAYGQGFPKATRIDTQIDKAAGAEREPSGIMRHCGLHHRGGSDCYTDDGWKAENRNGDYVEDTIPATDLARAWEGHRYGLQAMKPALEPIILFAKPESIEYNELLDLAKDAGLMLEELWVEYASNAEDLSRAANEIDTVLSRALGRHDQTCAASGSSAASVGESSTNPQGSSKPIAENVDDIAPESATLPTEQSLQRGNASGADQSLESVIPSESVNTVAVNVLMPPDDALCWKTLSAMGIDTSTAVDMLRYNSERAKFDLNTIWLWSIALGDACERASRSTTAMESRTITELRTLSCSLRRLTLNKRGMESTTDSSEELLSYAQDVGASLAGLLTGLKDVPPTAPSAPPSLSPIIVFQKPYKGKPVDSIVETGAGALSIDGARIGTNEVVAEQYAAYKGTQGIYGEYGTYLRHNGNGTHLRHNGNGTSHPQGRWPANFYLDEEAAKRLGEQSGDLKSGANPERRSSDKFRAIYQPYEGQRECVAHRGADEGTAARFFFNVNRQIDEADPVMYQAKASRKERDAGLEYDRYRNAHSSYSDFAGTPEHATNTKTWSRNPHPTVKPIDLTRWLATLLLPPAEYAPRRILVPFAGSGSEMIGAHLAGWEEIIGIEREREYVEIAKARLAYWSHRPKQFALGF